VLPKEGSHTKENKQYPRVQKFWVLRVQERLSKRNINQFYDQEIYMTNDFTWLTKSDKEIEEILNQNSKFIFYNWTKNPEIKYYFLKSTDIISSADIDTSIHPNTSTFTNFDIYAKNYMSSYMRYLSSIFNINFTEATSASQANLKIGLDPNIAVDAYARFGFNGSANTFTGIDNGISYIWIKARPDYYFTHELGHVLGLSHTKDNQSPKGPGGGSGPNGTLAPTLDSDLLTAMSYNSTNPPAGIKTFAMMDFVALGEKYGFRATDKGINYAYRVFSNDVDKFENNSLDLALQKKGVVFGTPGNDSLSVNLWYHDDLRYTNMAYDGRYNMIFQDDYDGGILDFSALFQKSLSFQAGSLVLPSGLWEFPYHIIMPSSDGTRKIENISLSINNDKIILGPKQKGTLVNGIEGSDIFFGFQSDVAFDGGPDTDRWILFESSKSYKISVSGGILSLSLIASGEKAQARSVELLMFNDKKFFIDYSTSQVRSIGEGAPLRFDPDNESSLSGRTLYLDTGLNQIAGQAYRVYKAAFNRTPDKSGLKYWIDQMDTGMSMVEVAARFIDSNEFRNAYGTNPSSSDFLMKVYQNVLGRTPDEGGFKWWLNEIESNPSKTRAKVLSDFSESIENFDSLVSLIGNGFTIDANYGILYNA
jgi:hypothetical protein